jgi:5'-phosphate synthase pdxT subunit
VTAPLLGVLALQGDVREHLAAFERCGARSTAVRLPAELQRVDGLAIPGGESTTMSRLLRVFGMDEPLRRRLEQGMPCLATCAGMILLSREVLDGRGDQLALGVLPLTVRRNGYGRQNESFEADLSIPRLGSEPFRGVFIRAPLVEAMAPDVDVLARHEGHPVAIAHGGHVATAFHPEMTRDDRLHRLFLERVTGRARAA